MTQPTWDDVYPVRIGGDDEIVLYEVPAPIYEALLDVVLRIDQDADIALNSGVLNHMAINWMKSLKKRIRDRLSKFGDLPGGEHE